DRGTRKDLAVRADGRVAVDDRARTDPAPWPDRDVRPDHRARSHVGARADARTEGHDGGGMDVRPVAIHADDEASLGDHVLADVRHAAHPGDGPAPPLRRDLEPHLVTGNDLPPKLG